MERVTTPITGATPTTGTAIGAAAAPETGTPTLTRSLHHVELDGDALAGRVSASGVFRPGDPGSYTDTMTQAFVRTDVIASDLLTFGQHIELRWQVP